MIEQNTYRPPTEAQNKARMRNWGIRNLRALRALCYQLTSPRREAVFALIDEELKERGAMTHAEHHAAKLAVAYGKPPRSK